MTSPMYRAKNYNYYDADFIRLAADETYLHLKFNNKAFAAKLGDKIGLQLLFCSDGWLWMAEGGGSK